jgi:hypothetical protein
MKQCTIKKQSRVFKLKYQVGYFETIYCNIYTYMACGVADND